MEKATYGEHRLGVQSADSKGNTAYETLEHPQHAPLAPQHHKLINNLAP